MKITLAKLISQMASLVLCALVLLPYPLQVQAQTAARSDSTQQLTEADLRTRKEQIVLENLNLSEQEKKNFLPVYNGYQKEISSHNEQLGRLIEDYANNYENMSDQKALALVRQSQQLRQDRLNLDQSYSQKFQAVLPPKKYARYTQIESKFNALVNYLLAREIPLVK